MALTTRLLHCAKNILFFVVTIMTSTPKIGFEFSVTNSKIHFESIAMIFITKYPRMN